MTDQNLDHKLSHDYQTNEVLLVKFEHCLEIGEQCERDEVAEDGDMNSFDPVTFLIGTGRELLELAPKGAASEERRT
jgi:hypothetical protein